MPRRHLLRALVLLSSAAFLVACSGTGPEGAHSPVDGEPTCDWPAVGRVDFGGWMCTGTLVAPQVVLTASHCVDYESGRRTGAFALDACQSYAPLALSATDVYRSLDYTILPPFGHADLALLHLSEPITEAAPVRIATREPRGTEPVTIVGFGCTGHGEEDSGTKRQAEVPWSPWSKVTCPGDSGGPWLNRSGEVVGVSSWGSPNDWLPIADHPAYPVQHRGELLRRMSGLSPSKGLTCQDWGAAASFGQAHCFPEAGGRGPCVETSDCPACCDLAPTPQSASERSCGDWAEEADYVTTLCDDLCGDAGPATTDCGHCCDLGE